MVGVALDKILHSAVAVAAMLALLMNVTRQAPLQTEPAAANLLASLFLTGIVITDSLTRKIPNALVLTAILLGFAVNGYTNSFQGVAASLAGLTVGLTLLLPLYLTGGMGAGDVKSLAALGALFGPAIILQVFLYTALIGGALSLLHFCCTSNLRQQSHVMANILRARPYTEPRKNLASDVACEKQRLPYAAAIALGFSAFRHWGPIVSVPW